MKGYLVWVYSTPYKITEVEIVKKTPKGTKIKRPCLVGDDSFGDFIKDDDSSSVVFSCYTEARNYIGRTINERISEARHEIEKLKQESKRLNIPNIRS